MYVAFETLLRIKALTFSGTSKLRPGQIGTPGLRAELGKSKCAVVFWSAASAASDNVRHEATVAKRQSKLISVIIEPLTELDIPLGLYSQQAANLAVWDSDQTNDEWRKFLDALEAKLTPRWVQEKVGLLDAELEGERARRESAENSRKDFTRSDF